jgi:hypothetical protein
VFVAPVKAEFCVKPLAEERLLLKTPDENEGDNPKAAAKSELIVPLMDAFTFAVFGAINDILTF